MNGAKIRLSPTEMELVVNAELILTKNGILKKVAQLLTGLQVQQQSSIRKKGAELPAVLVDSTPKISKGENYKGLPYLVLDYPRIFGKTDMLAIRTLFWWGNYFSITLQLSGMYKAAAEASIICAYPLLRDKGYYCSVNDDPWVHHLEPGNYSLVGDLSPVLFSRAVKEKSFIKLTRKLSLEQWDEAAVLLKGYYEELLNLLANLNPEDN